MDEDSYIVKQKLLTSITNHPSRNKHLISNLRAIDLNLGNYVDTARIILNQLKLEIANGNAVDDISLVNNIYKKSNLFFSPPLGMHPSDYIYSGIFNDPDFVNFYNENKEKLINKYLNKNQNILISLNLIKSLNPESLNDNTIRTIRSLLFKIIKLNIDQRLENKDDILSTLKIISKNKKLYKNSSAIYTAILLDLIETNRLEEYRNIRKEFDSVYLVKNFETKNVESAKKSEKKSKALFSNTVNNQNNSSFSFGFIIILTLVVAAIYYFIKIKKRRVEDFESEQTKSKEEPRFDELIDLAA